MVTPIMIAAGSVSRIDRYAIPTAGTDDITTARIRAARPPRTPAATPSVLVSSQVLPVGREADGPQVPELGPPEGARAMAVDSPDAIIDVQIEDLFDFSRTNDREARHDRLTYWALKAPAIAGASAASVLQAFGCGSVVILLATLAAVCMAVDGARPRGLLHKVHRKASHEARRAGTTLQAGWHLVQLECEGQLEPRRSRAAYLLRAAHAERQRIADYLAVAEASLGASTRST